MDFNIQNIKLELDCFTSSAKLNILYFGKEIGSLFVDYYKDNEIYIHSFGINQPFRHLGVGRKALEFVKEEFKDRILTLGVKKDNDIAMKLYQSEGFKMSRDCGYYWVMELKNKKSYEKNFKRRT